MESSPLIIHAKLQSIRSTRVDIFEHLLNVKLIFLHFEHLPNYNYKCEKQSPTLYPLCRESKSI